jgi:3(or 17)beta-hydroxysteroid dehydrogenase
MGDQVLTMRARNLGTNDLEPARQQALTRIPIGRMGTVTDIAKGIVFLASDDAGFMTGAASSSTAASPRSSGRGLGNCG